MRTTFHLNALGKVRRAAILLLCTSGSLASLSAPTVKFKHVVVILQENRTPDNMFGSNPHFEPGVDLATEGLTSTGKVIPLKPVPLATCFDINHSHTAYVIAFDHGKMDGADKNTSMPAAGCMVPPYPQYTYVDNSDGIVQPYFDIAKQYGWANRMYQTNQGPSYAAHQFFLAGTSAPTTYSKLFVSGNPLKESVGCTADADNTVSVIDEDGDETTNPPIYPCFEHPTLPDVLTTAGVTWKYYSELPDSIWNAPNSINHLCEAKQDAKGKLNCEGPEWMNNDVIGNTKVLKDIKDCKLAQVSWVTPTHEESDHPRMNDGRGPAWVAKVLNTLGTNPACAETGEEYWKDTAVFITWDDWGGFYDHVAPDHTNGQPNGWGKGDTYGFRTPLLVVSAYTPAGFVENAEHDSGSLLKFIETNFAPPGQPLGPIGPGTYSDAYADDLEAYFTLTSPRAFQPIHVNFYFRFFVIEQEDRGRQIFKEMAKCGMGCWF